MTRHQSHSRNYRALPSCPMSEEASTKIVTTSRLESQWALHTPMMVKLFTFKIRLSSPASHQGHPGLIFTSESRPYLSLHATPIETDHCLLNFGSMAPIFLHNFCIYMCRKIVDFCLFLPLTGSGYLVNRRGTRGVGTTTSRPALINSRRSFIVLSNNRFSGFSA